LLLLVFLLPPLAFYLLVLGWINRRPRPVMMGGAWEFAGVLFALSGVLLIGGPAFLASVDEKSRWFWLLGETEPARASSAGSETQLGRPTPAELGATEPARGWSDAGWTTNLWTIVRLLYLVVVAVGAGFILWGSRRLTSIYNVHAAALFTALELAFQRLGLATDRTGDSFLIRGRLPEAPQAESKSDAVQAGPPPAKASAAAPTLATADANTVLHVNVFSAMRHVTLRWNPSDSPVRRPVEQELKQVLAEIAPPTQEPVHSGCLTLVGVVLLALALVAGGLLILFRFYPPR
jgi:hypothetical protein